MDKKNRGNIIWNTLGSSLAAVSSLIFLIITTRINGINDAGIFTYGFATACLFYTIGIYATRTFQVTDLDAKHKDSDYIFNRITTSLIMLVISVLFCLIQGYNLYKSMIIILLTVFKIIEVIEETLYAVIQKNDNLHTVGKSMVMRSIGSYTVFLIADLISKNMIVSILSIIVFNILLIVFYDIICVKKSNFTKDKYNKEINFELLKQGLNTCLFSFLSIYILNASRYAIDANLSEEIQTIFGIIVMPAMVMSLLGQFIIHPFLVNIRKHIEENDYFNLKKLVAKLLGVMIIFCVVILVCAKFLGIPVLEILYNVDLKNFEKEFMIIMLGAVFYGISILIAYILISLRKTLSQVIILGIVALIALLSSNYLVSNYQLLGASYNYLLVMLLEVIGYFLLLIIELKKLKKDLNIINNEKL